MRTILTLLALALTSGCTSMSKAFNDSEALDSAPVGSAELTVAVHYGACELYLGTNGNWTFEDYVEVLSGDSEEFTFASGQSLKVLCDHRSRPNYDDPVVVMGGDGCISYTIGDPAYFLGYNYTPGDGDCG